MRPFPALGLTLSLSMAAEAAAAAGAFDGGFPLLCALHSVTECTPGADCKRIETEDAGAPDFFLIDISTKLVQGLGVEGRTSVIRAVTEIDAKLMLQGAEDGIEGLRDGMAWSAAIDQYSGKLVLSTAGERVAFVVFGACAALTDGREAPRQ